MDVTWAAAGTLTVLVLIGAGVIYWRRRRATRRPKHPMNDMYPLW
jgi:LPXTG-motif cell wall-anchored protein